jgi:YbbR domain-containing protein
VVVDEVVPGSVRLRLEEARSKTVQLIATTSGELPARLALAAPPGASPAVASVRGPARLLERLESISLEPVDLSEIEASGLVEVAVDTAGLGGLLISPLRASVGIRVDPAAERRLPGLSIAVVNQPGYAVMLEPDQSDLRVRGAETRLNTAALGSARLVVDGRLLAGMVPGESRMVPVGSVGLPALLTAAPVVDSVMAFRPIGGGAPR